MLPRALLLFLCLAMPALGAWAGYRGFDRALEFLDTGSVSLMMKHHRDAYHLALASFTVWTGLLGLAIPLSSLIAARFRVKANYLEALLTSLLIGLGLTAAAVLFYRHEVSSMPQKVGELLSFMRDSRREILLNPLNQSLLFGTTATLATGLLRALIAPVSGKGGKK